MGAEQTFDGFFRVIVVDVDGAFVDEERQGIVRHEAVVWEHERQRFDIAARHRHGHLLRLRVPDAAHGILHAAALSRDPYYQHPYRYGPRLCSAPLREER